MLKSWIGLLLLYCIVCEDNTAAKTQSLPLQIPPQTQIRPTVKQAPAMTWEDFQKKTREMKDQGLRMLDDFLHPKKPKTVRTADANPDSGRPKPNPNLSPILPHVPIEPKPGDPGDGPIYPGLEPGPVPAPVKNRPALKAPTDSKRASYTELLKKTYKKHLLAKAAHCLDKKNSELPKKLKITETHNLSCYQFSLEYLSLIKQVDKDPAHFNEQACFESIVGWKKEDEWSKLGKSSEQVLTALFNDELTGEKKDSLLHYKLQSEKAKISITGHKQYGEVELDPAFIQAILSEVKQSVDAHKTDQNHSEYIQSLEELFMLKNWGMAGYEGLEKVRKLTPKDTKHGEMIQNFLRKVHKAALKNEDQAWAQNSNFGSAIDGILHYASPSAPPTQNSDPNWEKF